MTNQPLYYKLNNVIINFTAIPDISPSTIENDNTPVTKIGMSTNLLKNIAKLSKLSSESLKFFFQQDGKMKIISKKISDF